MRHREAIIADYVRQILDYNPTTGDLIWKVPRQRIRPGKVAGSLNQSGYLQIGINGRVYRAHQIVWLHYYGSWPRMTLDHINGDSHDNRISNLRDVTPVINSSNQKKHRAGKLLGATKTRYGRWEAQLNWKGQKFYLGNWNTELEAHQAYMKKRSELGF